MAKWMVAAKKADFEQIAQEFGISPVLARLIRNRDMTTEEEIRQYLHGTLKDLHAPELMKDMEKAAEILRKKIRAGKHIRIIGDYDVDGICASYILQRGLSLLGADADVVIPHRIKDGYGLNDSLIEDAQKDGADTILTCDNGIAAASQIRLAKEKGMTVIVTDHHEVPFEEGQGERHYLLPPADAVVDPKQMECTYPFPQICGAVVAGKLIHCLLEKEEQTDGQEKQALYREILGFEALATVCDVMELKDENRIIVREGLKELERTQNVGMQALLRVNGIDNRPLTPYHAGFILGPCMNATGRLDTAKRALSLFSSREYARAVTIAGDLKSLNDSRKTMTEKGVEQAAEQIETTSVGKDLVLVIFLPECHESLAGIIAGRIKEKYGKPTFVFTRGEEGIKGSGRSVEAYHMYEEITACKELFTRYGGHAMAAGISMQGEKEMEAFRRRINQNCTLTEKDLEPVLHIDAAMPLSYASRDFIRQLSLLEPFGTGNPRPLFARKNISLLSGRKLGKNKNVGKYRIADEEGAEYEMIYFGDLAVFDAFLEKRYGEEGERQLYEGRLPLGRVTISMAYYPDLNFFAGRESVQIVMKDYC